MLAFNFQIYVRMHTKFEQHLAQLRAQYMNWGFWDPLTNWDSVIIAAIIDHTPKITYIRSVFDL